MEATLEEAVKEKIKTGQNLRKTQGELRRKKERLEELQMANYALKTKTSTQNGKTMDLNSQM